MNIPGELKYTRSHEWVRFLDGEKVQVGISDFAQDALGDIVFINLPEVGDEAVAGDPLCDFESVKAVEDILCPVSGKIVAVNEALADAQISLQPPVSADAPEQINSDPYGSWIAEVAEVSEYADLMDAAEYEEYCQNEGV